MLLCIPDVLSKPEVAQARAILDQADWVDGKATAGHQSAMAKNNRQLPENSPAAIQLGDKILAALARNPLYISAVLPAKIFPPLFNRYEGGEDFGTHVDNAIRNVTGTPHKVRTDVSSTLFLSEPDEYEGGELSIEDVYGVQRIKLPAGHMVVYPATSLHHITPVTRGARIASFFWAQSMVREDSRRSLLFDLDRSVQWVSRDAQGHPALLSLTGVYNNLLRQWAEI